MDHGYAGEATEPPNWQHLVSTRVTGGYKDNVLLSADLPEASPFAGGTVEIIGWRPVGEQGEFQGFIVGEHRQFLDVEEVDYEQTLVAQARYEHAVNDDWTLLLPLDYLYVDQVLDVSATEVEVRATRVQGHTAGVSPALQRQGTAGTFELELTGLRQFYAEPLDDSWEFGSKFEWQHPLGARTRADLFYEFRHAWYDNDPELTSGGDPIPGTQRRMQLHEIGANLRHRWGGRGSWRASVGLSGRHASDQAEGYYDYVRPAATARLLYQGRGWRLEGIARARHYAYRQQTVSDLDDAPRRRSELALEFRGQREIVSWLQLVIEYTYERTFANRPVEAYAVNTVSCGLEASF